MHYQLLFTSKYGLVCQGDIHQLSQRCVLILFMVFLTWFRLNSSGRQFALVLKSFLALGLLALLVQSHMK